MISGARRRALAAVAIAAAVTLAAWQTGDWWVGGYEHERRNLTVARIALFACVLGLAWAGPGLVRRTTRTGRIAFAAWAAWFSFWLLGQWPGLVEPDTVDLVDYVRRGVADDWYSSAHALLNLMLLDVVPRIAIFGVLQVLAMAALLGHVTAMILARSRSRGPVVVFALAGVLSVPLAIYTIHYSRDSIFAIGHVLLALLVARALTRRSLSREGLAGIAGLTALLSVYRGDGIVLIVVIPLLLLALRPRPRVALAGAGAFFAAFAIFAILLPAALVSDDRGHDYSLTLRMNPLGAVLQSDFYSRNRDADLAVLNRVVDVDRVRKLQVPYNIPAFWAGAFHRDAPDADWKAFDSVTNRLFFDNPATVAANRLENFAVSSALAPGAFHGTEYIYPDWFERVRTLRPMDQGMLDVLTAEPPIQRLYFAQEKVVRSASEYRGLRPSGSALHWTLVPWLLLLMGTLLAWRRARFEAIVAAVILARVPLLMLVAPIAQFKYYNSVHLGALVVLGLLLARIWPRASAWRRGARAARPSDRVAEA